MKHSPLIVRVPNSFIIATISISILPALMYFLGADFSSNYGFLDLEEAKLVSGIESRDLLFSVLSGSFIHTLLEWSAIVIAVVTVVLAFVHFQIKKDVVTPIIGVALFTAGCMDLFHILAADRLITATAPNQDFIPFTWAISRVFNASIIMVGVILLLLRGKQKTNLPFILFTSFSFGLIAYLIVVYCATQTQLPQTTFPDSFVSRPWDLLPLIIYFICGFWLYPKLYTKQPSLFTHALWISLIPQSMTEIHMAFGSVAVFDSHFNIGHFLKVVAYTIPLAGLLLDYLNTYKSKIQLEQELSAEKANLELKVKSRTQDLEQSEAMMHSIIATAMDAVIRMDHNGNVLAWNKHAESTYGWSESEALGEPITRFICFESHDDDECSEFSDFLKTGNGVFNNNRIETTAMRKDGESFVVEVAMTSLKQSGKIIFNSFSRDITQRKLAEENLSAARQEAVAANNSKSEFLANMSHEIRTPMNAILGMSHLALQSQLEPKQRHYIDKVHNSAENLLGIINDILDFSKIEAGKLDLENCDFRLEHVFDNTSNLIGINAEEKGLELLFAIDIDLPTELIGDRLRLNQILLNLGNNAVKFTETGEIVIGVKEFSRTSGEVELHFWVQDSGMGMSNELQSKLFQSFSQADSSTTRKYGGTGLGLAISKQLVEMMNGRIWVDSEEGKGSTFHFTARFGLQQKKAISRAFHYDELKGLRVLVVDDNACASNVLVCMVEGFGLMAESVSDGVKAIERIREADKSDNPFELILMDWKMPQMSGIDVVQKLQQEYFSNTPTIIMVTAYSRDEVLKGIEQLKINLQSILTKPVSPSTLLEAMGDALGKHVEVSTSSLKRTTSSLDSMRLLSGAKILLVEDNDINQELAMELLQQCDIEVVVADNGRKALAILAQEPNFDGVLMDCQMPVMDGYEATRAIRQMQQFERLPILAMTANAMVGDREKVIAAGMNDHISKPLNVELMYETMARWFKPNQSSNFTVEGIEGTPSITLQLEQLSHSLIDYDTEADDLIEKLKSSPELAEYLEFFERMTEHMIQYDFDSALLELNKIIEQVKP
ncbi:response regulator [Shewanella eurypsychrophilus]|uniref:histidine kinase n=1 Tax=Shewanella eurypsychrophilus TaxID=2593656 RepID=A0ABX6V6U9_9GAMM|nr:MULTISPECIES: response regulator [Shewanella]QFU23054.1 response regulator [Shewanella sp. YLB-09]QPG58337.1 response regulator [Shewanella eurypsychrophilus]